MFRKFKFEQSLYPMLAEPPFSARYKLDVVGIRIKSDVWKKIPLEERNVLCHLSVRSQGERDAYREFVILAIRRTGAEPDFSDEIRLQSEREQWENPARIPLTVAEASLSVGLPLRLEDWLKFDDMERYVLFRAAQEKMSVMAAILEEFLRGGASFSRFVPRAANNK
jgi:hypothetical protein